MNLPKKLYHYSGKPITELVRGRIPEEMFRMRPDKPPGLWFSVEDFKYDQTWPTWCRRNDFEIHRLKFKHLLKFKENVKILYINSKEALEAFTIEYKDDRFMYDLKAVDTILPKRVCIYGLRWLDVAKEYDGIIIAPYMVDYRFPCLVWYYGWDCASGCVWNYDAIESLELVPKRPYNKKPRRSTEVIENDVQRNDITS